MNCVFLPTWVTLDFAPQSRNSRLARTERIILTTTTIDRDPGTSEQLLHDRYSLLTCLIAASQNFPSSPSPFTNMSTILLVSFGYLVVDMARRSRSGPRLAAWLVWIFRQSKIMVSTIVPVLT